jgi:PAS domain S-box-containing protein
MIKILAIDDNNDNLISLKAILHDVFPDAVVLTSQNGRNGIELALSENPDVILLDVVMPGMDGFEVCRRLKKDPYVQEIPVVFLTALKDDRENRIKALEVGAEGFISKPIDEPELIAQIRAMVKIKAASEQRLNENARLIKLVAERTKELEKELRQRKIVENKYRELFEANSDSIAIFQIGMDHTTLNFVDCNENNAKLLGYSKEEIIHFQPNDIEVPISNEVLQWRQNELLKNGQIGFETKLIHKSGVLIDVEIKAMLINFNNRPAIMNISRDITKRKQIEEKIKLLAYSLESISECVSITDNDDLIIYVNKSFINTYGYSTEELIGQHTSILRPSELAFQHVRDILPVSIEGGWRGEIMNRKKDGTLFPILLSTSIIKDEKEFPIALIGVATDISDMRKARAELIAAKEQAVESNRLKTAFLNNMSHEIRTPMNHIMGFSSLLSEAKGSEKDEYAQIIQNSSNQLLSLIENVILLSRLQSEKIEINKHAFDPRELLSSLSNLFKPDCKRKNVALVVKIPNEKIHHSVYTDLEKIKQILIILTTNAVKYTRKGFIEVGYDIVEKIHEFSLQFYVRDSGIGIPKKEHEKIFDSFYRTEQAILLAIGGTGLGLSIAKEFVRSLDGSIWFESEPEKGSCFYFSIPAILAEELAYEEKQIHNPHLKLKDMSILIADDEQINFLYLEILLKSSVKKIDHAYNGKEAVEMVSQRMYDLIFMDLKMPEMNGYDATKKIKLSNPDIPIIAQTAYASVEDKEKAVLAGCDDFIAKPIKKNVLLEVIEKYC